MNMLLEIQLFMTEGSKTTGIWSMLGPMVAGQECCLGRGAVTARFFFSILGHAICILASERLPL